MDDAAKRAAPEICAAFAAAGLNMDDWSKPTALKQGRALKIQNRPSMTLDGLRERSGLLVGASVSAAAAVLAACITGSGAAEADRQVRTASPSH
ncbi:MULTISPECIES: hypothetical protein [Glycomyces]|uniref:Ketopantoate reductase n=1 Tax=Glycomyces lechevalierae TaxID=256034 RepID=A0A9X3PIT7_9ACTN|nr:hypothetical protein [Glycomyces lechevalierae]MDA1386065.1 hypothetical protein [Glycomyces lechevalierae]MDR7340777.1 ketopantoate reductase [Glycomyces lechevalierae]